MKNLTMTYYYKDELHIMKEGYQNPENFFFKNL